MFFNLEKNVNIIAYMAKKEWWSINYTKFLKLLFLADKLYLRRYGKTISWDSYFAMKLWPVASWNIDIIKTPEEFNEKYIKEYIKKKWYNITIKKEPNEDYLALKEKETLDEIYNKFGHLNYSDIVHETHKYNEWKKYKHVAEIWSRCSMDILDFFENSEEQDDIFNSSQRFLNTSREIYLESQQ